MKKKITLILAMAFAVLYTPSVMAVTTKGCISAFGGKNVELAPKIPNTVHTVILVIQIAVPIVLVIMGMLDLFKAITAQKEDEIKKGQQMFIKRLLAAAIVFFVIAIVKLLFSFVADDKNGNMIDCVNCFLNGVNETDGTCKNR